MKHPIATLLYGEPVGDDESVCNEHGRLTMDGAARVCCCCMEAERLELIDPWEGLDYTAASYNAGAGWISGTGEVVVHVYKLPYWANEGE